jgi:hypothetical protein
MSKFAPAREDGLKPYVVTEYSWGHRSASIVWSANLAEAKRHHGWTRQLHTSLVVRRAMPEDMPVKP